LSNWHELRGRDQLQAQRYPATGQYRDSCSNLSILNRICDDRVVRHVDKCVGQLLGVQTGRRESTKYTATSQFVTLIQRKPKKKKGGAAKEGNSISIRRSKQPVSWLRDFQCQLVVAKELSRNVTLVLVIDVHLVGRGRLI
jgi:hypothetical protein